MSRKLCLGLVLTLFVGMEILTVSSADAQIMGRRRARRNCCQATCEVQPTCSTCDSTNIQTASMVVEPTFVEASVSSCDSCATAQPVVMESYAMEAAPASSDCGCSSVAAEPTVASSESSCCSCSQCCCCRRQRNCQAASAQPIQAEYMATVTASTGCSGCNSGCGNVALASYPSCTETPVTTTSSCGCGATGGEGVIVSMGTIDGTVTSGVIEGCQGQGCGAGVTGEVIVESSDSIPVEAPATSDAEVTSDAAAPAEEASSEDSDLDTPPAAPSEEEEKEA